jgi:thiamine pyrophosphokinase
VDLTLEHTVAIIANGCIHDYQVIAPLIQTHMEIIAVDGGCNHCAKMGILPDLIIGDFDSIDPKVLNDYQSVPTRRFSPEKNETDLELAIQSTYTPEIKKITVFGALEQRTDHTLANLHLIRRYPNKVFFETETEIVFSFDSAIEIPCVPGQTISFMQLGDPTAGIRSKGLKWELNDATFSKYFFSLSNICLNHSVHLSIAQGDLLCILQKPPT